MTYDGEEYKVMSIGYEAFRQNYDITSVVIPEGVDSIGDYAFYCCSSLTSVVIHEGVTSIASCAFQYCNSLREVTVNAETPAELDENVFSEDTYVYGTLRVESPIRKRERIQRGLELEGFCFYFGAGREYDGSGGG